MLQTEAASNMGEADPSPRCKRNKIDENPISKFTNDVFPDDLLFQILIRLPSCKFSIRCSLVCKRWRSLIFSPHFIPSFNEIKASLHPKTTLLIQVGDNVTVPRIYIASRSTIITTSNFVDRKPLSTSSTTTGYLNFLPEPGTVLASFKDLLLVSGSSSPPPHGRRENYYICNPLTRLWVQLPEPPRVKNRTPTRFGLSYEEEGESYRVLLFCSSQYYYKRMTLVVFRSETWKWNKSVSVPISATEPICHLDVSRKIDYCNGAFHWLHGSAKRKPHFVVAFDPDREKCRLVDLPLDFSGRKIVDVFLGVCMGRLRLIKVVERKIKGEWKRFWEVWEQTITDHSCNGRWSWSLVHDMATTGSKWMMTDRMSFHPNNGDIVFSSCEGFARVFQDKIREGKRENVLQVVGDDINYFPFLHDDGKMITAVNILILSNCNCPPTPFPLLHSSRPTPLPMFPST